MATKASSSPGGRQATLDSVGSGSGAGCRDSDPLQATVGHGQPAPPARLGHARPKAWIRAARARQAVTVASRWPSVPVKAIEPCTHRSDRAEFGVQLQTPTRSLMRALLAPPPRSKSNGRNWSCHVGDHRPATRGFRLGPARTLARPDICCGALTCRRCESARTSRTVPGESRTRRRTVCRSLAYWPGPCRGPGPSQVPGPIRSSPWRRATQPPPAQLSRLGLEATPPRLAPTQHTLAALQGAFEPRPAALKSESASGRPASAPDPGRARAALGVGPQQARCAGPAGPRHHPGR